MFPKEVFQSGGTKLLEPEYEPRYKAVFREQDLEAGQAIARLGPPPVPAPAMGTWHVFFCTVSGHPQCVLLDGSLSMFSFLLAAALSRLCLWFGCLCHREGFRCVVITSLDPYEFQAALEDSIPLGYMEPVYVNPTD